MAKPSSQQIHPAVYIVIGAVVFGVSLAVNASTESNFIIFVVAGAGLGLFGVIKLLLLMRHAPAEKPAEHHQHQAQQQPVQHAHHQQHHQAQQHASHQSYAQRMQNQQHYQTSQAPMQFCPNCGARAGHANFCPSCGQRLR